MPTTYSTSLRLSLIATGEQAGTWGTTTNTNLGTLLEQAITGYTSISMTDANYTLSTSNGSTDESRNICIKLDGGATLTATRVVIIPNVKKTYYFWNATAGSQLVRIGTSATPTTYVDIPNGYGCYVFCDGSNAVYQQSPFINASTGAVSLGATSVSTLSASSTVTGTSLIPSGSSVPTNGIYLPAANTVGVATSSTARFYFGSAGQIGIGGATYGTSGQVLKSGGASAPPTWGDAVTSVAQSFTGGLISVSGSPITTSGTLALTVAGTSGGIPYFSSASTWASSGALAANAIVIGGGAGVAPATTTTGTGVLTALGNTVNGAGGIVTPDGTATLTGKTINASNNTITNISLSTAVTGTLPVANGGTGNTLTPSNGQVPIGDGSKYVPATLTAGSGISITNASGSVTIASTSSATPGVNVQTFTTAGSNTWTKPSGYAAGSRVFIQAWGAGGGGGRGSAGTGGGGGGYNERWLLLSNMGATETITVGTGGAARTTNGAGNNGTDTTVGSLLTAYAGSGAGGGGGQLSAGSSVNAGLPYIIAVPNNDGTTWVFVRQGDSGPLGADGTTYLAAPASFQHGGGGAGSSSAQTAGNSFWGGGGGGSSVATTAGTSKNGGNGGAGSNASNGTAGSQPGGGGGATNNGTSSGKGGDGQVVITVFPA
jgi:hypothetical protein